MAKQNYRFEKRQKELAKKKKQDEKRMRKSHKNEAESPENANLPPSDIAPIAPEKPQ